MNTNTFTISSPTFSDYGTIPAVHSHLGGNRRPTLQFANIPPTTKSLAIICHDPDAPVAGGFYHWTIWNLPPNLPELSASELPVGAKEGITSWGSTGWNGPQPPSGTHRYQFHLYALNTVLQLPSDTTPTQLYATLRPHILAKTTLTGLFHA